MGGLWFSVPFFGIAFAVIILLLQVRPSAGSSWGKPASDPGTTARVPGSVPRLSLVDPGRRSSPCEAGGPGQATIGKGGGRTGPSRLVPCQAQIVDADGLSLVGDHAGQAIAAAGATPSPTPAAAPGPGNPPSGPGAHT